MPKKLPPLGALRAFEAASRHISFVRAAEELSVSPAAISHQIKVLEHWVGAKLFERSARGVSISRAGQEYASGVREIFDRLISTSASLRKNRARQVVHIRAQFSPASSRLLPRVLRFNQANTDIEIQLSALNFDRNPSKGGADIALIISGKTSRATPSKYWSAANTKSTRHPRLWRDTKGTRLSHC